VQLAQAPGAGPIAPALRAAYRCDCDGASHLAVGAPSSDDAQRAAGLASSTARAVETETGTYADGCPWRALYEPLVAETLAARRMVQRGDDVDLAALVGLDTPHRVVEAVRHYSEALMRARGARAERETKDRERAAKAASAARRGPRG
jgi:hypothetical protein